MVYLNTECTIMKWTSTLLLLLNFIVVNVIIPIYGIMNGDLVEDTTTYASFVSIREVNPEPRPPLSADDDHAEPAGTTSSDDKHQCGGVLIAKMWILTAAHCIGEIQPSHVAGIHVNEDGEFNKRIKINVGGIVKYPSAHERYKGVDAALVPLEEDATKYGATVAEIHREGKKIGEKVVVIGMGANDVDDQPGHTRHLRYYNSEVAGDENCYPGMNNFIPEYFICVGTGDPNGAHPGLQRTGYGDSGGPLYIRNSQGELEAAGIVSGGVSYIPGENVENEYIRFTMNSAIINWISDVIATNDVSHDEF